MDPRQKYHILYLFWQVWIVMNEDETSVAKDG